MDTVVEFLLGLARFLFRRPPPNSLRFFAWAGAWLALVAGSVAIWWLWRTVVGMIWLGIVASVLIAAAGALFLGS